MPYRRFLPPWLRSLSMPLTLAVVLTQVRVHRIEQMCSGPTCWRITLGPPQPHFLILSPGIYRVRSYTLTNGFGIAPAQETAAVIPLPPA